MSRLTRDGTAESVSRDQTFKRERGQGNIEFPYSADHEQDWQPYPVDPYSAMCDDCCCCVQHGHHIDYIRVCSIYLKGPVAASVELLNYIFGGLR